MSYDDDIEQWQSRSELYRWRSLPVETHEAMREANRIRHTVDLARGAMDGIVEINQAAELAVRRRPEAERAIREIEAVTYMVLPAIVGRYGFRR